MPLTVIIDSGMANTFPHPPQIFDTPERIGDYRIDGILGRGGMGVVYRAHHLISGDEVALKTVFTPNERQMMSLRREIRALAQLTHPGVVRIISEGVHDGLPWYAMEYIKGTPLDQYCSEVIWQNTGFEAHWTLATQRHFHRGSSSTPGSETPWVEVLKTTLAGDEIDTVDSSPSPSCGISIPGVSSDRMMACGGKLAEVLTVFNRICQTLAYIHGHGIVHRDLKPSNIVVRPDGSPVLIDFGLMLEFWGSVSRDELESIRSTGGTLFYIAPEQIMGDSVDARADLYALGCILYEFVTGQLPFQVTSSIQAIEAHLRLVQVSPSTLVDGVPAELDELILNLLQKKPQDRIGYADDVSRILIRLGAAGFVGPSHTTRTYLYRPRFAGRSSTLDMVIELIDKAISGNGRCILIGGESGIGKTRLLQEIYRYSHRKRIRILAGECDPCARSQTLDASTARSPLGIFKKAFRELVEECLGEPDSVIQRVLITHAPILSRFFPDILRIPNLHFPDLPDDQDINSARLRVFQAICHVFQTIASQSTLLLLLDDLQWIDDMSRDLILFQLRTGFFDKFRVALIGAYRTEEITGSMERLVTAQQVYSVNLSRLDETAVQHIISDMLAKKSPSQRFVRFLTDFSEGSPFFICEYLRACIDERLLFRDTDGQWQIAQSTSEMVTAEEIDSLPLPRTLINLVEHRLELLSESARDLAMTMSAIGRDMDVTIVWSVVPFQGEILDAMDELMQHQIVIETAPGFLRFVHDILFQRLYSMIDASRKIEIHSHIASAIEMSFPDYAKEHPGIMGRHWEHAGDIGKAGRYYLTAARSASATYSPVEAEKMYQAYFSIMPGASRERLQALNEYARSVLRFQARSNEAYRAHRRAYIEARALRETREEADSIIGLSQYLVIKGQHRRAKLLVIHALEVFRLLNDVNGEIRAVKRLAFILSREGAYRKAEELLRDALELSIARKDQRTEASLMSELGALLQREARLDDALVYYTRALEIQHLSGNRHLEARDMKSLAMLHFARGDLGFAEQICERAMFLFREIGDTTQEGQLAYTLAGIVHAQGQFTRALSLYENALSIRRIYEDQLGEGLIHTKLGDVHRDLAHIDRAVESYQRAISIFHSLDLSHYERHPLIGLAFMERVIFNAPDRAQAALNRAHTLAEPIRDYASMSLIACEQAHVSLSLNQDPTTELTRAETLTRMHMLINNREVMDAIRRLQKAISVRETDLFRGEYFVDRSPALQKWLKELTVDGH